MHVCRHPDSRGIENEACPAIPAMHQDMRRQTEATPMVKGKYNRTPEGLTYRSNHVLIRGQDGLVAVIDESSTDHAVRMGLAYDAQWRVSDRCGCDVGTIRRLNSDGTYEIFAFACDDERTIRTRSFDEGLRWISRNETACEFRTNNRTPRRRRRQ